jgi:hypothetical protein
MGEITGVIAELDPSSLRYSTIIPKIDTDLEKNTVSMVVAWSYLVNESEAVLIEPVIQEVNGELLQVQNDQYYFDNLEDLSKKIFIAGAEAGFEVVTVRSLLDSTDEDREMSVTERVLIELEQRNITTAFAFNALYDSENGGFQDETRRLTYHPGTWLVITDDNKLFVIHKNTSYTDSIDGVLEDLETAIGREVKYIIMGDPGYSVYLDYDEIEYEIAGYNEGSTFRLNASFSGVDDAPIINSGEPN